MTRVVNDMQRFQVPYNFFEVPEIQIWLDQSLQSVQVRFRTSAACAPTQTHNRVDKTWIISIEDLSYWSQDRQINSDFMCAFVNKGLYKIVVVQVM